MNLHSRLLMSLCWLLTSATFAQSHGNPKGDSEGILKVEGDGSDRAGHDPLSEQIQIQSKEIQTDKAFWDFMQSLDGKSVDEICKSLAQTQNAQGFESFLRQKQKDINEKTEALAGLRTKAEPTLRKANTKITIGITIAALSAIALRYAWSKKSMSLTVRGSLQTGGILGEPAGLAVLLAGAGDREKVMKELESIESDLLNLQNRINTVRLDILKCRERK